MKRVDDFQKGYIQSKDVYDEEQLKDLQSKATESSFSNDLKSINPDTWNNIPICLVKTTHIFLE